MFEPGGNIGAYRIVRSLGEGGMGQVFLAQHRVLERFAAIKVLNPHFCDQPEVIRRFVEEARSAAAIRHRAIVPVLDCDFLASGSVYIVMDRLRGANLRHALTCFPNLRDNPRRLAAIVGELSHALQAAHDIGIVHRDVKPENIFLTFEPPEAERFGLRILDFGIAKLQRMEAAGVRTRTGVLMGTPHYMSPEQCQGDGGVDHRADIYSLGCLAYELISGRLPFESESLANLLVSHLSAAPTPLAEVAPDAPPELAACIERMLNKDPEARPQAMLEVASAMAEFLDCKPTAFIDHLTVPEGFVEQVVAEESRERTWAESIAHVQRITYQDTPGAPTMLGPGPAPVQRAGGAALARADWTERLLTESRSEKPESWRAGLLAYADSTLRPKVLEITAPLRRRHAVPWVAAGALSVLGLLLVTGLLAGGESADASAGVPMRPAEAPLQTLVGAAIESAVDDVAEVYIESTPPGAQLWIEGEKAPRGTTPLSLTLSADVALPAELHLPGHRVQRFEVRPQVDSKLSLSLIPHASRRRRSAPRPARVAQAVSASAVSASAAQDTPPPSQLTVQAAAPRARVDTPKGDATEAQRAGAEPLNSESTGSREAAAATPRYLPVPD